MLLVGARCIPEEEYYRWKEVINKANQSIENRDEVFALFLSDIAVVD